MDTGSSQHTQKSVGYHLYGSEMGTTRGQQIAQADLNHLTLTLFGTVANPERIIELTREQLLARSGWKARLEYRNHHEFPVDEALYQPIETTVHQFQSALDSLPGGYIAVLGMPGSGKSTLLTQTLRGRPERVIRYYAYVPDAQDPRSLRGESENFLHDVVLALERAGCRVEASPSIFDRSQLLLRFHKQLQHLHEDWQATGRKTVILIDGLDHIAREQHPQHSLLRDLPLPNQVPEGVYIVLGSQTDQLVDLPDRVQRNIRQPEHRIQMQSLPREAVLRVVERVNFPVALSPEQMERIFALSEGHPLALAYLVKHLQGVADPKAIDTVLDTTQPIWPVVEQYVHTLFEGCSFPTDSPDLNGQPSPDSPSRAIADLLLLHIDHPVYAVAQASKRTCAKLLLQRDLVVQSVVHEYIEKAESQQEHILMVLDTVSLHNPKAVAPFRNNILSLYQSPNYAIRRTAQIIGRRLGCEETVADPHLISLPAIYQLSFLQRSTGRLLDLEAISAEKALLDSDDPVNIIRPFDLQIGLVAKKARLPKVNMYHRTAQIMVRLAPFSSWSEDGERQLRAILDSAGLRPTFYRPRAVLARRAMLHIIAELIDAHALGSGELFQLDSVLRFYDPHMFLVEPIPRPASIAPMEGKNRLGGVNEAWLEQTRQTADSACCKTDDGLIVLAEGTTLKWLEWGTPTEIRCSVVAPSSTFYPEDIEAFFSKTVNRLVSEYPFLRASIATPSLVVRHSDYAYDSPGNNWLALNPTIGSRLGWSIAEDGLFRWVNNAGQTMVESIWWTDGLVGQAPPHFDDEVGEGWLVVASQVAWDAITAQLGTLKRMVHVERSFYDKGERLQSDLHAERILDR